MDKGVLEDQIKEAVNKLFAKVQHGREEQLKKLIGILEQAKGRCESDDSPVVLKGLVDSLKSSLSTLGKLPSEYVHSVEEVTSNLDEHVTLTQSEDRFTSQKEDSAAVRLKKAGKRFVRNMGKQRMKAGNKLGKLAGKAAKSYTPWTQDVPLKELVAYHLADQQQLVNSWIDHDARQWIAATDIVDEELLGKELSGSVVRELLEAEIQEKKDELTSISATKESTLKEVEAVIINQAEKTGTTERRNSFYAEPKSDRKATSCAKNLAAHSEQWQSVLGLLIERSITLIEFLQFSKLLKEKAKSFNDDVDAFFDTTFLSHLKQAEKILSKKRDEISGSDDSPTSSLAESLQTSKDELRDILEQALADIDAALEEQHLDKESERFSEQVFLKANDLMEEAPFLYDIELDASPPKVSSRVIEWRLLVVRALKEHLLQAIKPGVQQYHEFIEESRAEIEEIAEVIEVNFDSAIELSKSKGEKGEDPLEIIEEGIDRTLSKMAALKETIQQKQEGIKVAVIEKGDALIHNMFSLMNKGDAKELQAKNAKYRVKETAQGWRTKLGARWARLQDRVLLFYRFVWKKAKQYTQKLQAFFGFKSEQVEEVKKADIATYLTETDAKIKELPYIYRKLFNFDVDADRRFYVSLHENFNYFKKSYESWENGFPATFAVMGEKGSGKSTYLSLMEEEFLQNKNTYLLNLQKTYATGKDLLNLLKEAFDLEKADTKEEVIEEICTTKEGSIMVVECLQNLYLRNINGYEAIEDFMYILSETKDNVFWVVSCSRYAWNYLNVTHSLGEYFSHLIQSDRLDQSQITSVIMNRHRSSGYELIFEPDESHIKSRAYRKLVDREEEAQQYLRETYFEDLADLAEGNASIAMIFWIRSIREFDETHCYIKPLEVTTLEMVQELKPNILFTLAAIILHDALSPAELCSVLQFNEQQSRLILNQLKTRGLLQQKDGQYAVNQLMYRQVVRVLKERNIIHLV